MGDYFALQAGEEMLEAKTVILATGVVSAKTLPGEGGEVAAEVFQLPLVIQHVAAYLDYRYHRDSSMRFITTWAEISRLAASGMTRLCGESITSSETIMLRLTGRQCMK